MDVRGQSAPSLELEDSNEVSSVDQRLILCSFVVCKHTFVCPLRKRIHPLLNGRCHPELSDSPSGLRIQTVRKGIQQFVEQRGIAHAITVARNVFASMDAKYLVNKR